MASPNQDGASDATPLSDGRARAGREAHALRFGEAVAAFTGHQDAWPRSVTALRHWARHYRISVVLGPSAQWNAARQEARTMLVSQGLVVPPDTVTKTAGQLVLDRPAPAGPVAVTAEWGEEACVEAVACFLDQLPSGIKPTVARYRSWPPNEHNAPWPRVFEQFGGWKTVLAKARNRR